MKKNMAITMVKDVFKEPHFQIKRLIVKSSWTLE